MTTGNYRHLEDHEDTLEADSSVPQISGISHRYCLFISYSDVFSCKIAGTHNVLAA